MIDIDKVLQILFYIFIGFGFIQILYFFLFYFRVVFWKRKEKIKTKNDNDLPPASVIIVAKNESDNLKKNLTSFLTQKYPNFRVIVVDDGSEDDSATVLAQMKQKYSNLYVTGLPEENEFRRGKKTALVVGIKAAKTDILLFSDADCKAPSENWIRTIVENYNEQTEIVIGFGAYNNQKGLLNKIIRSDTVFIGLQYIGFALAKIPYMAVGRNMSYKKSLFMKNKGFANHMKLLSGSDDLFVNENASRKNVKVDISPDSLTFSDTKQTSKEWSHQKIRHLTTGKYYKFIHKVLLFLEPFTRIFFFIIAAFIIANNQFVIEVSSILAFRFILLLVTLIVANKKFKQKNLLIVELFYDIFQPIVNLLFYFKANKNKEYLWK
ncbi:MAG: glycosyltransferase [Bacteroidota bacterium]|nr:glycosyltransferase [Bacteroidota bacterium]